MSLKSSSSSISISNFVPELSVDLTDTHPYHLSTFFDTSPDLKMPQLEAICSNGTTVSIGVEVRVGVVVGVLVMIRAVVGFLGPAGELVRVAVAVGASAQAMLAFTNDSETPET